MKRKNFIALFLFPILLVLAQTTANAEDIQATPYKIDFVEKNHSIHVNYPQFTGFTDSPRLNQAIQEVLAVRVGTIEEVSALAKGTFPTALYGHYDYKNAGQILSCWLLLSDYTGGAHGSASIQPFTLNTKTGETYTLPALFQTPKSTRIVAQKVIAQIKDNPNFWPEAAQEIAENADRLKFYLDGNQLVIYFDQYEIGPYVIGMPTFKIPLVELKEYLKTEVYLSLKDAAPLGKIRKNGTDLTLQHPIYQKKDTAMLPVQEISNHLGYTINDKTIQKISGWEMKNNVAYVPLLYFLKQQETAKLLYQDDDAFSLFCPTVTIQPNQFLTQYYRNLLAKIAHFEAFSAGSSLKSTIIAAKLLNWTESNPVIAEKMRAETEQYLHELDQTTAARFALNFQEISQTAMTIINEKSADLLDLAGNPHKYDHYTKERFMTYKNMIDACLVKKR